MDHAHDEFFAGTALSTQKDCCIQRGHASGEFKHILHRRAAGDELLRCGTASDALAEQVQLALTFGDDTLAAVDLL